MFYFLYVRRHALDQCSPKASLFSCKELLENFWSYYNCKNFGVLLTMESRSDASHACKFCSLFLFFSCTEHNRSFRFL